MTTHRYCNGFSRRDFLRVGALGTSGLTLESFLRMSRAGQVRSGPAKTGILVYLTGGPSHLDTFDMKPEAPEEYRGEFKPISTNVSGIQISEHLPKLAQHADKYSILRGVSHTLAAHRFGREYLNTGNRPLPSLVYPGYASVVSNELSTAPDLPTAVAIPRPTHSAGFLGVANTPLSTGRNPRRGVPFTVRGMSLRQGLTVADVSKRQNLLNDLDGYFAGHEQNAEVLGGLDKFSEQAYKIISSRRARKAFDVSREPAQIADRFGDEDFGQACLLAVRLIDSGVRFVTLELGGWDTHTDNFARLKDKLLPTIDVGLAGLFSELHLRGLLDETSVMVTGEFGRTPKINQRGGRDHYPRSMFVLMGGGGMQGGHVIGASDDKGTGPAVEAITPDSVAATFYHSLGIDHQKEYHTSTGRPVMIVRDGHVIQELFS